MGKPCQAPTGSTPAECEGLHCVDGVCCGTPCANICERCDEEETVGACVPVLGGLDIYPYNSTDMGNACVDAGMCNKNGHCAGGQYDGCSSDDDCEADKNCIELMCSKCPPCTMHGTYNSGCFPLDGGYEVYDYFCCPGSGCYEGECKKRPGSPCVQDDDCGGGTCVDGVCCKDGDPGCQ